MARLRSATVARTPRTDPAPDPATPGGKQSTASPSMPKSKIPTGKRAAKNQPKTPMKEVATAATPISSFKVPEGEGGFGFQFSNGLAMQGRKLLNGLTGRKTPAASSSVAPPATPSEKHNSPEPDSAPRGSQTEPRPLKKKKRFSDIHRQQFAKMDSIATHYSAKRVTPNHPKVSAPPSDITPKNAVLTPEMAPKGIKRSKSQAVLSDREIPVSPSPVKMQQPRMPDDDDDREENPSPVKRQKLDPSAGAALRKKSSKIARFAPMGTSTPMKSARPMVAPSTVAGGALGRGLFPRALGSTRKMPAFPRPVPSFNLTPATTLSAAPSKIPTTPGRGPSFRTRASAIAGGSKLNTMTNSAEVAATDQSFASPSDPNADLSTLNLSTPARGTPKPPSTTVDGFTFRSRGSGLGFGALSEIHKKKMELPRFASPMGTPKVSENDPVGVEDPFAHIMEEDTGSGATWEAKSDDMAWTIGTPAAKKAKKTNKRKEVHQVDEAAAQQEAAAAASQMHEEEREAEQKVNGVENSAPTPARKRLRFDTASGREEERDELMEEADEVLEKKKPTLAEAVAKANRKRRLNQLATPKKRVSGEGDRLGRGKTMWK